MNPRVQGVRALEGLKLELAFTNGEAGTFDCSSLVGFGIFAELKEERYFQQVKACDGTVVWPHGQDICPDTLYLVASGKAVMDGLGEGSR